MNEYMKMLGFEAKDVVTGFKGVVVSVCFDLYGCVMVVLNPPLGKDGKPGDGQWFDAKRITITGSRPVMVAPNFAVLPAGAEKGPAEKPFRNF